MLVDMVLVWNFIPVEDILGTDQINVLYGKILYFQLVNEISCNWKKMN